MKAYSYIRFSTKDQLQGDSQRRQTEAAAAWCKANGVELVQKYSDLGVSAFRGANKETGALSQFLKAVESGKIPRGSILLVESFDRISRENIQVALRLFMQIMEHGVDVVTLADGRRYNSSKLDLTDLIIFLSVASRANEESAMKSSRVKAVWSQRRKVASLSGKPIGMGTLPGWIRRNGDKLELIPERAKTVQRIYREYAAGGSFHGIARGLREDHVPNHGKAVDWTASSVRYIMVNRAAGGEHIPHDDKGNPFEPIPNYFPPAVKRELFATVQNRLAAQTKKGVRLRDSGNVFAGLIRTPNGGTFQRKHRDKNVYYLIPTAYFFGKEPRSSWRYDHFIKSFLALTDKASLAKSPTEDNRTGDMDIARLELADIQKQAGRLADFLARGKASSAVVNKLEELELEQAQLKARIATLENQQQANPTQVDEVDWEDTAALRENLRATVRKITMDAKARCFKAEFLDGRVYEYTEKDGMITVSKTE